MADPDFEGRRGPALWPKRGTSVLWPCKPRFSCKYGRGEGEGVGVIILGPPLIVISITGRQTSGMKSRANPSAQPSK